MPSPRPESLQAILELDDPDRIYWQNQLWGEGAGPHMPDYDEWKHRLVLQIVPLMHMQTPLNQLHPSLHTMQRCFAEWLPIHAIGSPVPQAAREQYRKDLKSQVYRNNIEQALRSSPLALKDVQKQVHTLLDGEKELIFGLLPAMLNAINKQLNRPQEYLLLLAHTPSEDEMSAQLAGLQVRKPFVFVRLMQLLIRAAKVDAPAHPKGCGCLLCKRTRSMIDSASSAS